MSLEKPTEEEVSEVTAFLKRMNKKYVTCRQMVLGCPSLKKYRDDAQEPLLYIINSVCAAAKIKGGIEEGGYEDFLAFYDGQ